MDTEDEDQVKRKHRFQAAHPEWHFIAPDEPRSMVRGETDWRAVGPPGQFEHATHLSDLLNQLEKLTN